MRKSILFMAAVLSAASLLISCEPEIKEVDKPVYIDSFTATFFVDNKMSLTSVDGKPVQGVPGAGGPGMGNADDSGGYNFTIVINKLPELKKKNVCFCIQEDADGCLCGCDFTKDGEFCKCDKNPSCTCAENDEMSEMSYWEKGEGEEPLDAEIRPESKAGINKNISEKVDKIYLNETSFYIHVTEPYINLSQKVDEINPEDISKLPQCTSWYIAQEPIKNRDERNSLIYSNAVAFKITKKDGENEVYVIAMKYAQLNVDDTIINWKEISTAMRPDGEKLSITGYSNSFVKGGTFSGYETGLLQEDEDPVYLNWIDKEWQAEQITQVYTEVGADRKINLFIKANPLDYGKKVMIVAREINMNKVQENVKKPGTYDISQLYTGNKLVEYTRIPLMGSCTVSLTPASYKINSGTTYMFYAAIYEDLNDGNIAESKPSMAEEYPVGLDQTYKLFEESNDILISCVSSENMPELKKAAEESGKYKFDTIDCNFNVFESECNYSFELIFKCAGLLDENNKKVENPAEVFKTIGKDYIIKLRYEDDMHYNLAESKLLTAEDFKALFTDDGLTIKEENNFIYSYSFEVLKVVDSGTGYMIPVVSTTRIETEY